MSTSHTLLYTLLIAIAGLLFGRRMFQGMAVYPDFSKWSYAYLTLIVAIPCFLLRSPRPLLGASLKAAPVCALGLAAGAASSSAIFPGLPIWLGAFIPCLILAPFAIALTSGIKT